MLKVVADKVDRKLVKSMKVRVKEVTNQKLKDIKTPSILNKFRAKKSRGSPVLELVEKDKFAIDTPGEKRELRKIRKVSKKTTNRKTTKKKVVKRKVSKKKVMRKKKTNTKRKSKKGK